MYSKLLRSLGLNAEEVAIELDGVFQEAALA
jgi:sulfur carrier protein ThiS